MSRTFVIGDIHGRRAQLATLVEMLPAPQAGDTLVLLGDLIDRGEDAPGVLDFVLDLQRAAERKIVVLRGNHEQMLIDLLDGKSDLWFHPNVGSYETLLQYGEAVSPLLVLEDFDAARREVERIVPPAHIELMRSLPCFYEDEMAIYVHAGLANDKPPCETDVRVLLWTRDPEFFKNYRGKPCVFGHTPTQFLPLMGRLGRHGIYVFHSCIGIDTGYTHASPLTCLELPRFTIRQTFANGRQPETHHLSVLLPVPFRAARAAGKADGATERASRWRPL